MSSRSVGGPTPVDRSTVFPLLQDARPCPLCSGHRLRPLHVYPNSRRALSAVHNLALMGCELCGIVFSHPLPADEDLERYYSGQEGWESRISENETIIARKLEVKRARHAQHLATLEQVIGRAGDDGQPRKAFDFGCGLGAWLDVLEERGWETYGLEPGQRARAIAGRRHSMVREIPRDPEFDLVLLSHVLEHLRTPLSVVRALAGATKQGGHIYISVPDFGRLPEHRSFSYVKNERHIFSFTWSSLRSLLSRSGFELVAHSSEPSWPGGPVDKNDAKGLKAVGERVDRELELPPDPLAVAIASMRDYEPYEAGRLTEAFEEARSVMHISTHVKAESSPHLRRRWRPLLGSAAKRIKRFLFVRVRAGVRFRARRLRDRARARSC